MVIANPRYIWNGVHPELLLELDGREAALAAEAKPTVHEAGLVFVGEEFSDILPDITDIPGAPGTTLRGFSADPTLFRLFDRFLADANSDSFTPGPVGIPAA